MTNENALNQDTRDVLTVIARELGIENENASVEEILEAIRRLKPKPKEDLGVTLKRQMQQAARKEAYAQAWECAILDGATRDQAHEIAKQASEKAWP